MTFEHLKKLVDMMFVDDGNGGVQQRYDSVDPKSLNPLVLAYIGDAYFHLFVRGRILSYEQSKVQVLHQGVQQVKYRRRKVIQIMILSGVPSVICLLAERPIRY